MNSVLEQDQDTHSLTDLSQQLAALEEATVDPPTKIGCVVNWRDVIDTSNDAFLALNAAGEVLEWNVKAEELFGWSAEEAVGHRLSETLLLRDGDSGEVGGLKPLLNASNVGKRHELTVLRRDGQELPVEASVSMMRCGSSIVFNAFIHDISRRRQLQLQLTQAQKLESIGQLSAGIAHEINTPTQYVGDNTRFIQESLEDLLGVLTAYEGLAAAVRSDGDLQPALAAVEEAVEEADVEYLTGEMTQAVTQTLEGVRRVASIVRAMKEFSHPGSTSKTPTDLNAAIRNTVTVATNEWKYVATIEFDLDEGLPPAPVLPGDFNQVILNLLVNSAQAIGGALEGGEEKGVIRVSTRRRGAQVEVRVEDSGPGIPEEYLNRVFDPFFTTKDVGVGSGQGLAISRSVIVDKHGGTLEAGNLPDGGAAFTICVPLGVEDPGGLA